MLMRPKHSLDRLPTPKTSGHDLMGNSIAHPSEDMPGDVGMRARGPVTRRLVLYWMLGANMGEVIRFVPKSERERSRLIREARAIYDSIFPPANAVGEQRNKAPVSHPVSGANARSSAGVVLS
jgi:hypothetical protein